MSRSVYYQSESGNLSPCTKQHNTCSCKSNNVFTDDSHIL